ncbi:GNAT family N-acetyltransferase [Duganella sp. FT80W]|uniref:GNAT family N-acetyltransferase n=1 Tax=Duganella guangzhouensis TaxID=2666084 RepID=A0A6I2L6Q6_9BURK|nr:GNAT family N-acetyltransferase [Duganella guangzhouensis]MRW92907.1 GNAT family N-acetyltransferase [Duganella guangzhouensis]
MDQPEFCVVDSISELDPNDWQDLAGSNPTLSHTFLEALHATGCAAPDTGWAPRFLLMYRGKKLCGAMPLYLKFHSRGEYVFDQGWADAFQRNGIAYYPKLLSAIPFTPVTGNRILARSAEERVLLARVALQVARQMGTSSLHILFPSAQDRAALVEAGYMMREGVQFHWENHDYADFDAFLATMKMEKRKKLRQDRRRVQDAGIHFEHLAGKSITEPVLRFFYQCYTSTYQAHYSKPYLTLEFFQRLLAEMPENLMIVLAKRGEQPVAVALNLVGGNVMYGRYWGTQEFVSGLHFETCYVQSIEYCIKHGISSFEGGAQGVHKMSRGLIPTPTWSAHWIADERFAEAIADFLAQETTSMNEYIDELNEHVPFKAP